MSLKHYPLSDLESLAHDGFDPVARAEAYVEIANRTVRTDPARAESAASDALALLDGVDNLEVRFNALVALAGACSQGSGTDGARRVLSICDEAAGLFPMEERHILAVERLRGYAYGRLFEPTLARESDQRAIEAATSCGEEELRDRVRLHSALVCYLTGEFEEAHTFVDQIEEDAGRRKDQELLVRALRCRAGIYFFAGELGKAIAAYIEALEGYRTLNLERETAGLLIDLASAFGQLGDHEAEFNRMSEALRLFEESGGPRDIAVCLNNMGNLKIELGDPEEGLISLRESLALKRDHGFPNELVITLRNIGRAEAQLGRYEEAERAFAESEEICNSIDDPIGRLKLIYDLVDYHFHRTQISAIDRLLDEGRNIAESRGTEQDLRQIDLRRARLALEEQNGEAALQLLDNLEDRITKNREEEPQPLLHSYRARAHTLLGNERKADQEQQRAKELVQAMALEEKTERLRHRLVLYDLERTRAQRQLAEKRSEILALEKRELEEKAETRRKELMATALFLTEKNEVLRGIAEELQKITPEEGDLFEETIAQLKRKVADAAEESPSWEIFERQFNRLNGGYLEELARRGPDLTPTEVKVCALAKSGLSIKETAAILTISPASVEKYRYRARKKLGIERTMNLTTYLHRLSPASS